MKLTIFGSTGGVGRQLVARALEQGHDVTAFARHPERLGPTHERLRVVQGDVLDPVAVDGAVRGQDAVLCALGMPLFNTDGLREKGTANIVDAMAKAAVAKLVCLSVFGAGEDRGLLPCHYRYFIVPVFMRHVYADHERQEARIKESGLDWTLVRPVNLTNGERTGAYRLGAGRDGVPLKMTVSRADVADFMLTALADPAWRCKAIGISS